MSSKSEKLLKSLGSLVERDCELGRILYLELAARSQASARVKFMINTIRADPRRTARLRIRHQNCRYKCLSCPHPVLQAVMESGVRSLRGTSTELRTFGYHRTPQQLTTEAKIMRSADRTAHRISALCSQTTEKIFAVYRDIEQYLVEHEEWIVDEPPFAFPGTLGMAFEMPFITLAYLVMRCNDLIKSLQLFVYHYTTTNIMTKYHKWKPGILAIALKHENRNPLTPALPTWKIYLQNFDRKWFSSSYAAFKNPYDANAKPKKISIKNTAWIVVRTGNRKHIYFYQAAQQRFREVLAIRNRVMALNHRVTREVAEIIKSHKKEKQLWAKHSSIKSPSTNLSFTETKND